MNERHEEIEDPLHAIVGTDKPPVIAPGHTFSTVTDKISSIVLTRKTSLGWYAGFGFSFLLTLMLFASVSYLFVKGIGIWGNCYGIGIGMSSWQVIASPPLAPGAYRVVAFDRPQPELEYRNPEAMRAYEGKGPVVRIAGGQTEHVRLQVISSSE